jgi:hypothetical protein
LAMFGQPLYSFLNHALMQLEVNAT